MKTRIIFLYMLCGLSGLSCAKLQYLEEALVLKDYSDESEALAQDISERDALFDQMLSRLRQGDDLTLLGTGQVLKEAYGDPVLARPLAAGSPDSEWLYRKQLKFDAVKKVYFVIDGNDKIQSVRWVDER